MTCISDKEAQVAIFKLWVSASVLCNVLRWGSHAYVIASVAGHFYVSARATLAGASAFRLIIAWGPRRAVNCLRRDHALEHGAIEDPK